jgi:uncharacterized membrane protein
MRVVDQLSFGISVVGVVVITWGVLLSVREFITLELSRRGGVDRGRRGEQPRRHLSSYLLLGLEFLVAADVIRTIIKPSLQEVTVLGAIVAIRTVLSYFLNLEYRESMRNDL